MTNYTANNNTTSSDQITSLIRSINFYYPIVLSIVATVSNVISFMVFTSKSFKSNPSALILKIKSLVDILNVYAGTLRFTYSAETSRELIDVSKFLCYSVITVVYSVDAFSSWLNVFISLDRLFLVLRPSTYQSISRRTLRKWQICSAFLSLALILIINVSKLAVIKYINNKCTALNQTLVDWINFTITLVIPFAIMIFSSSVMTFYLVKKSKSTKPSKSHNFIKTVLTLDICFLVFNMPRFIVQLNRSTAPSYSLVVQLTSILKYSFSSMTVLLWIASNNLFRSRLAGFVTGAQSIARQHTRTQTRPLN